MVSTEKGSVKTAMPVLRVARDVCFSARSSSISVIKKDFFSFTRGRMPELYLIIIESSTVVALWLVGHQWMWYYEMVTPTM